MTTKQINKAIRHTGLEIVYTKGDGVFYFLDSEGYQVGETVYVCYLNQLTLDQWVRQAEECAKEGRR
jgi:hypothetical protein